MVFEKEINNRFVGLRIDVYLTRKYPYHTRNVWQRKIEEGAVRMNGHCVKASTRIPQDSVVTYDIGDFQEVAVNTNYAVLYEDDHLLIIDKPADIPVHTSGKYFNNTLIKLLRRDFPDEQLNLINRLDRETSGVILLGKNFEACRHVGRQFMNKQVRKTYIAYTFGEIAEQTFRVEAPIAEEVSATIRIRMGVDPKGLPAETDFEVLCRANGFTKLYCYPRTGRTNQIRVHLAHYGFPIVGDKLYSGNDLDFLEFVGNGNTPGILERLLLPRQALHANRLIFTHPASHCEMEIVAPEPPDLLAFQEQYLLGNCQR
ncbi:MAG: hypothetical protein A2293_09870 [Elusimicrobia bacterium RIFOXYB2_FULL_49_7]|nr:MAG: hypothetical protein A2293_09870 [Elusimicrobia bacterium RIFOXYB2_FULL_49_7]